MKNPTVNVQAGLVALYSDFRQQDRGGWREVGQLLDISGAYARQLAEGARPITPKIARRYLALNLAPAQQHNRAPRVGIGGLQPEVRAGHDARRNGKTWNQYLADMLQEPPR